MKIEVIIFIILENVKIEILYICILFILKELIKKWIFKKLIKRLKKYIVKIKDSGREDFIINFLKEIQNDEEKMKIIILCGDEMIEVLVFIKMQCNVIKLSVERGCLCFKFCFVIDIDLEYYLYIFCIEDKEFNENILKVLFEELLLEVFEVDFKSVGWKIFEVIVIKGQFGLLFYIILFFLCFGRELLIW